VDRGPLKGSVAKKIHDDYTHMARRHLIPALGRLNLRELTAEHLDELYAKKLAEGLSARTVGYIHYRPRSPPAGREEASRTLQRRP
jgi:hypothetical protein